MLQRLQQALGHSFSRPDLLVQALTHRSFASINNERLEFLGDSVLNCTVARALYDAFPDLPEGSLSRLRANLVRQETLPRLQRNSNWATCCAWGKANSRAGDSAAPPSWPMRSNRCSVRCFDAGFDTAQRVVCGLFDPLVAKSTPAPRARTPRQLQEIPAITPPAAARVSPRRYPGRGARPELHRRVRAGPSATHHARRGQAAALRNRKPRAKPAPCWHRAPSNRDPKNRS